eukprot:309502_1
MDTVLLCNWILLSIIWILILPYIAYTLYIYIYHKRPKVYFQKRKPLLIDIVIGLVLSGIFFENQSLVFLEIYSLEDTIFAECLRFFNISSMIAIYMIIMIRIYLLYFQSQYNEATISRKWKEYVNEEHEDFFLSNIHSFGDDIFLIKLSSIIWVIVCVIYIILDWFIPSSGQFASWFLFAVFISLFFFAFHINRKFPDFHDTLYIRKELQYFVLLNFLVICIWTILLALTSEVTSGVVQHYSQVIMYCIIFWISIDRVVKWNEVRVNITGQDTEIWKKMSADKFALKHIVESPKGYEQFMKFLVTEFATENLLFVTEYIQLKGLLSLSDKEMRSLNLTYWLSLPENLPIPKIIQDLNLDLEQIRATQRYRKDMRLQREQRMQESIDYDNSVPKPAAIRAKNPEYTRSEAIAAISPLSEINNNTSSPVITTPPSTDDHDEKGAPLAANLDIAVEQRMQESIDYDNSVPKPAAIRAKNPEYTRSEAIAAISPLSEINNNTSSPVITTPPSTDDHDEKGAPLAANLDIAVDKRMVMHNSSPSEASIGVEDLIAPVTYSVTVKDCALADDENDVDLFATILENDTMNSDDDHMLKPVNINALTDALPTEQVQTPTEVRESFIEEMAHHKEVTMHELLSVPSVSTEREVTNASSSDATGANKTDLNYAKDDIDIDKKERKEKIIRHHSLSLKSKDVEKTVKLSERVRNHSAMISHSIRTKSSKLKTKVSYHMREASQSMALKYKKNERLNVLDCKSFSILCTKLYYKYIASGVAPLEVNLCSATRVRCTKTFEKPKPKVKAPNVAKRSSKLWGDRSGTRARTISRGVVSLLSKKNHLVSRNDAMDILKGHSDCKISGGMRRSTSRKKIAMTVNTDEPFNGDIVMAMSELLPPLEKCAREIDDLLKDSLSRFKKTHTCCKLYTEYCDKKKMETLQRTMSM